ncbi:MAG: ATP-binding protein [Deltaproteobacteria bacterium]|nr:ATP-binding protein [Deltaproteobacteria bacterium]
MIEIVVLSGKGGTGKTSLTGAFAHLSSNRVVCDLDVDAPDLHLLLDPSTISAQEFRSGHEAVIRPEICENCGECIERCRFEAILPAVPCPSVNPLKCEGCKVCVAFCPVNAVDFPEKLCGHWFVSKTRFGWMVHAQLLPAEENSGRLVALLRQQARELAKEKGFNMILSDGPPGIGCPVISSLSGTSLAVIVTEPTPSGRHDLERIAELCEHFKIPAGVIINKCDLHEGHTRHIESFCLEKGLKVLGALPHDTVVTHAMVAKQTVTEYSHNDFSDKVKQIWIRTKEMGEGLEKN